MATSTSTLGMTRLHPKFGVEISGVTLRQPLDDGTWAHIWEAFNEHSLLVFRNQPFTAGLKSLSASPASAIEERYETPTGKRRLHHVRGREQTVAFANAAGARLEVVLRAHDDGVAFRYRFPETDAVARTVVEEQTAFTVLLTGTILE